MCGVESCRALLRFLEPFVPFLLAPSDDSRSTQTRLFSVVASFSVTFIELMLKPRKEYMNFRAKLVSGCSTCQGYDFVKD